MFYVYFSINKLTDYKKVDWNNDKNKFLKQKHYFKILSDKQKGENFIEKSFLGGKDWVNRKNCLKWFILANFKFMKKMYIIFHFFDIKNNFLQVIYIKYVNEIYK